MNKFNTLLFSLAMLVGATACEKSSIEPSNPNNPDNRPQVTIEATIEQDEPQSRTSLSEGKVLWTEGDQITVILAADTTKREIYTLSKGAGTPNGEFRGMHVGGGKKWAVYGPFKSNAPNTDPNIVTIGVSPFQKQTLEASSFGNGANPMVAQSDAFGENFAFKNVCGAVRFQVKDIEGVKLRSINIIIPETTAKDEVSVVCGDFTVDMRYEKEPVLIPVNITNQAKQTGLSLYYTTLTPIAQSYTIVLPAGKYPIGTIFSLNKEGSISEKMEITTKSPFVVERSRVTPLATIEYTPNGTINFPDEAFRNYLVWSEKMKLNAAGTDIDLNNAQNKRILATTTSLSPTNEGINSLEGIKYFGTLTELDCSGNKIQKLDLRNNPSIQVLDCSNNKISELLFAKTTNFTYFACNNNYINKNIELFGNRSLIAKNGASALYVGKQKIMDALFGEEYSMVVYVTPEQDAYPLTDSENRNAFAIQVDNQKLQVGSYYYEDGTWSYALDNTKTCLGVVFEVNDARTGGKAVGLKETYVKWIDGRQPPYVPDLNFSDNDGRLNMLQLKDIFKYYLAAKWITQQNGRTDGSWKDGDRWYFPAKNELGSLYDGWNGGSGSANEAMQLRFNAQLTLAGGTSISAEKEYWSSSSTEATVLDYIWTLSFVNKQWFETPTLHSCYVRAIMWF